jgi:Flp pilus assembly CpaF family ATPase
MDLVAMGSTVDIADLGFKGSIRGEEAVLHLIERIVGPLGLRVDESSPWAERDFRRAAESRPNF